MNKKNIENLVALVKEMNEDSYTIDALLLREYQTLLDDEITTKQALLLELLNKHTKLSVSDIADLLKVSSSAVSQIIAKLEKTNYVKREINLENRREIIVQLGEAGIRYFAKHEQVERAIIERFYAKLDYDEVIALKTITSKLKAIVEKEYGAGDTSL